MYGKLAIFAAMGGARALVAREAGCSLTLNTGGAVSYPVGQASSGQTRAGSDLSATTFTLNGGALTDSSGKGCWWTPPADVLQCDQGQVPQPGFEIGCNGGVSYNGSSTFYECSASNGDEVNIYLLPNQGTNCAEISLTASGCYPSTCSSSGSQSATAATSAKSTGAVSTAGQQSSKTQAQSTQAQSTQAPSVSTVTVSSSCAVVATPAPVTETVTSKMTVISTQAPITMTVTSTAAPVTHTVTSTAAPVTHTVTSKQTVVSTQAPVTETITSQCSSATVSVPVTISETETKTQTQPASTPTTTATIPVYSTSVQTKASTIETTATQSSQVTVPVYSTSIATQSIKTTASLKTTVPVYSTSVVSQSGKPSVPVYSYSHSGTPSASGHPTTLSQKTSQPATTAAPSVSSAPASKQSTASSASVTAPSNVAIPTSCPANGVTNAGELNRPSLIIVTDKSSPSTANGTQYFADITPTRSTIFNFDIPTSDAGKTCTLNFFFPEMDSLTTGTYTFSGSGALDFAKLSSAATQSTSYSNAPSVASDLGQFTVSPGNAYTIGSFACPSGSAISIEVADVSGGDTNLYFFEDYNVCPLGLFITTSN